MSLFTARNILIIGSITLFVFIEFKNEEDFYDDLSNNSATIKRSKTRVDNEKSQGQNSRLPASSGEVSLAFADKSHSPPSKTSVSSKTDDLYERESEPADDYDVRDDREPANSSAQAPSFNEESYIVSNSLGHNHISNDNSFDIPSTENDNNITFEQGFSSGGIEVNGSPQKPQIIDTKNFDIVGSGGDPNAETNTSNIKPVCKTNRAAGTYASEIEITLSCDQSAEIYYCIGTSGLCCDSSATQTKYSGPLTIGSSDDNYCLSFYGQSVSSFESSDVNEKLYLIDSTIPSFLTEFPKVQVQTTELPLMAYTQSTDFGKPNYYFHQINTKGNDPTALQMDCEDVFHNYGSLTGSITTLQNYSVSSLTSTSQIDQEIGIASLQYGSNFMTSILEDRDRLVMGCQQQNIILYDFQVFSITSSVPASAGTNDFLGSFVPFSHFQENPNTTTSGTGDSTKTDKVLKEGFLAITH